MNAHPRSIALLLVLVGVHANAQPVTVPALGPRYRQTRERIDALFQYRNGTYPLSDPSRDLFRFGDAPPPQISTEANKLDLTPSDSDDAILRRAITGFNLGRIGQGGVSYVTVNEKRYKEGESVPTRLRDRDKPVFLFVKYVTLTSVTFSYHTAEQVIQFASLKQ